MRNSGQSFCKQQIFLDNFKSIPTLTFHKMLAEAGEWCAKRAIFLNLGVKMRLRLNLNIFKMALNSNISRLFGHTKKRLPALYSCINCRKYASSMAGNKILIDEHLQKLEVAKTGKEIRHHRKAILKIVRTDPLVEKSARERQLLVPLDAVREEWSRTRGFKEVAFLAKYYELFRDIFNGTEFIPKVWLDVNFENKGVFRGNLIAPSECLQKPQIKFTSHKDKYNSLVLVNPEGCYPSKNAEILHWMVINIPGNKVEEGKELSYIPPLPWKGSGFHRFCFSLFEHSDVIDDSVLEKAQGKRMEFKTADFAKEMEQDLTPIGLGWFQTQWDESVSETAKAFGIFEPIFEWEKFKSPKELRLETKRKLRSNKLRIKYTDNDILSS